MLYFYLESDFQKKTLNHELIETILHIVSSQSR